MINTKKSYDKIIKVIKKFPTSNETNQDNEKWSFNDTIHEYINSHFGVKPGDETEMRQIL